MAYLIFILAAVMGIAGVFGGLINYYQMTQDRDDEAALPRCIVMGIGASFLVPVILFFVQSDLITDIQSDPSKLLIYTGFCLIVAIASRLVLTSTPKRILNEAIQARAQVEEMQHQLRTLQEEILPLIDTETEQETGIDDNAGPLDLEEELDIAGTKVLQTLGRGRHIYRSMAGLCREAEADETTLEKSLKVLVNRQLAGRINTRKGMRWYLTEKGRRSLDLLV